MKHKLRSLALVCISVVISVSGAGSTTAPKENVFATRPLGVAVKQVGQGIDSVTAELLKRDTTSYFSAK